MFKTPVSPTPTSDGAFPDKVDAQTPLIGYMPGHMPWRFGERLEALGVEIINAKAAGGAPEVRQRGSDLSVLARGRALSEVEG